MSQSNDGHLSLLFDAKGRFHCLPDHGLAQLTELFRHQFLHALHEAKLVSDHKIADLLKAVWAVDPLQCPHCHGALRPVEILTRPEAIVSTHWVPKEIHLDDEHTLMLDPS